MAEWISTLSQQLLKAQSVHYLSEHKVTIHMLEDFHARYLSIALSLMLWLMSRQTCCKRCVINSVSGSCDDVTMTISLWYITLTN